MIAEFAKKINDILIKKGIVQKEDADLYRYGIENGITVAGNLLALRRGDRDLFWPSCYFMQHSEVTVEVFTVRAKPAAF